MEHSHRYFLKGNVTVHLTSSLPGLDLVGNDNRFTFLTKSKPVTVEVSCRDEGTSSLRTGKWAGRCNSPESNHM